MFNSETDWHAVLSQAQHLEAEVSAGLALVLSSRSFFVPVPEAIRKYANIIEKGERLAEINYQILADVPDLPTCHDKTSDLLYSWRKHIAYVPQEVYLFDGSIRSNLQWIRDDTIDDVKIWAALDAAAAGEFIRRLPGQLDARVGERGVKLSGGERQRIALARALLKKPDLLILDEATSSLDRQNEGRIRDALRNLHGSMMIIIIAYSESVIEHADYVVALEGGCVKA